MNKKSLVKALEFSSVVGFGVAYFLYDIRVATFALMALMTLFVVVAKLLNEPLTKLQWITWLVIVVLGGATLSSENENYIKMKPSIINAAIALILFGSQWIGKLTMIERLVQDKIACPPVMLRNLNLALSGYFALLSGLNLYVAYNFSTTQWVNFKLFGILALNFLCLLSALFYLRRYLKEIMDHLEKK